MISRGRRPGSGGPRRGRGQALVEFALVAPVFFLAFFAILEAGRFMFYYESLNNATREGARYAIVHGANTLGCSSGPAAPGTTSCDPTGAKVVKQVRDSAFGVVGAAVTVTPTWHDPANNGRGSTITVTATYTYASLIPIVPLPQISVEAESSLVVNN
jgi:Flp pilus assembly protein TadG